MEPETQDGGPLTPEQVAEMSAAEVVAIAGDSLPDDPARAPFKRITSPGTTDDGRLFVTIEWDGRKLSLIGVEGPKANGDCRGSCGQTGVAPLVYFADRMAEDWEESVVDRLRVVWDRWHLNDMQPACEHQRADKAFDTSKPLELQHLTWGPRYHDARSAAAAGKLDTEDYATWQRVSSQVTQFFPGLDMPKHPDLWGPLGAELLAAGMLAIEKTKTKPAGWVDYREHPEGLLSKPCPVCGYAYGSAWLHEEVPTDVLEFLRGLPDNADDMPARWRH